MRRSILSVLALCLLVSPFSASASTEDEILIDALEEILSSVLPAAVGLSCGSDGEVSSSKESENRQRRFQYTFTTQEACEELAAHEAAGTLANACKDKVVEDLGKQAKGKCDEDLKAQADSFYCRKESKAECKNPDECKKEVGSGECSVTKDATVNVQGQTIRRQGPKNCVLLCSAMVTGNATAEGKRTVKCLACEKKEEKK